MFFFLKKRIHWISRCTQTSLLVGHLLSTIIIPVLLMIRKGKHEAERTKTKETRSKSNTTQSTVNKHLFKLRVIVMAI